MKVKTNCYKIYIKVLSPIHIGSGDSYIPYEYVIKDGYLFFLDREKLTEIIIQKGKYEDFLNVIDSNNILKIRKFIYDNFDNKAVLYKVKVSTLVENEYKERLGQFANIERGGMRRVINALEIKRFVREKFANQVIIPGSSVKGAIRTAVLSYIASRSQQVNANNSSELEQKLLKFWKIPDDPFKNVKVSDFKMVNGEVFIDVVRNTKSFNTDSRGVPVKMELVLPGAIFEGDIKFIEGKDNLILENITDMNFIFDSLEYHYTKVLDFEQKKFEYALLGVDFLNHSGVELMKMGNHSGAMAVTIDGYRKIYNRQTKKIMKSQTTTWRVESLNMPMGWVVISNDIQKLETISTPEIKEINRKEKNKTRLEKTKKDLEEIKKQLLKKYKKSY
ncbi:type III-A CRISPR-associated RAMP protein Csm5 [Deferribacter abyssi]|uniref:type III-A CRISPR-associated RAMP protein Csm5 n=1 Tax=Deferribacter abyssi TaxID=213806 RepID=UPI003C18D787